MLSINNFYLIDTSEAFTESARPFKTINNPCNTPHEIRLQIESLYRQLLEAEDIHLASKVKESLTRKEMDSLLGHYMQRGYDLDFIKSYPFEISLNYSYFEKYTIPMRFDEKVNANFKSFAKSSNLSLYAIQDIYNKLSKSKFASIPGYCNFKIFEDVKLEDYENVVKDLKRYDPVDFYFNATGLSRIDIIDKEFGLGKYTRSLKQELSEMRTLPNYIDIAISILFR